MGLRAMAGSHRRHARLRRVREARRRDARVGTGDDRRRVPVDSVCRVACAGAVSGSPARSLRLRSNRRRAREVTKLETRREPQLSGSGVRGTSRVPKFDARANSLNTAFILSETVTWQSTFVLPINALGLGKYPRCRVSMGKQTEQTGASGVVYSCSRRLVGSFTRPASHCHRGRR